MKVNERRITAVASGFQTKNSRSRESAKLLNWGLRTFDTIRVASKNISFMEFDVWHGKKNKVGAIVTEDLYFTVPKRKKKSVKAVIEYEGPLKAPVLKGDKIGTLTVFVDGELKKEIDIFSKDNVKRVNIFSRLFRSLNYLVWGDV